MSGVMPVNTLVSLRGPRVRTPAPVAGAREAGRRGPRLGVPDLGGATLAVLHGSHRDAPFEANCGSARRVSGPPAGDALATHRTRTVRVAQRLLPARHRDAGP